MLAVFYKMHVVTGRLLQVEAKATELSTRLAAERWCRRSG